MKLIFLLLLISPTVTNAASCDKTLSFTRESFDPTARLISYLNTLTEARIIDMSEIASFAARLEQGSLTVPIPQERLSTDSEAHVHYGELQRQLKGPINSTKLLAWAQEYLKDRQAIRTARKVSKDHTEEYYLKAEFHRITIGTSESHTFEMMTTPVTQKQWVELMGENPASHNDGDTSITMFVNGKSVRLRPDNPIERVTWWSAQEYANRFSRKAGLKPAYDHSKIKFQSDSTPESGTWHSFDPYVPKNIQLEEGYRLPTKSELKGLVELLREQNPVFARDGDLHKYAWYANTETQPVASLAALRINGAPFYDLLGNVWEWVHDDFSKTPTLDSDHIKLIFGGSFNTRVVGLREIDFSSHAARHPSYHIGFRLVRTVKP